MTVLLLMEGQNQSHPQKIQFLKKKKVQKLLPQQLSQLRRGTNQRAAHSQQSLKNRTVEQEVNTLPTLSLSRQRCPSPE